ncbi:MAG TPA: Ig-like domain-containing protein [Candidatus Deferrimicrobium sp.]|nr:Ig-like domain-containing protein [Candidatus Deferrimicrobium sp.]
MMKPNFKQIIKRVGSPHVFTLIFLLSTMLFIPGPLPAQTYGNIWTNGNLSSSLVLRDVVWSGSRFIAVGDDGMVFTSSSGSSWTRESVPLGASDHLFGVGHNSAGTIVAVGRDQLILYSINNGDSWTLAHGRVTNAYDIYKVAYGNGKFVAVDEAGGIWISVDGKTGWTKYNSGLPMRCITFANGYFMAGTGSGNGAIVRSATANSGSWEAVGTLGMPVRDIEYGNGKWLAVGRNIATSSSAGGTDWVIRIKLADYNFVDQLFSACANAPGSFIAVGEHGLMLNSSDGVTWRQGDSKSLRFLFSLAYGNTANAVAAVGNGGPRGLPPEQEQLQLYSTHYSRSGGTPAPVLVPKPVISTITVVAPNGGEQWLVGKQYPIQWVTQGTVASVNIDFSSDGKKTWTRLSSNYANRGLINWTIPDTVSTNCFVRVTGSEGTPTDTSNTAFAIVRTINTKTINVTSPNGGESWVPGERHDITWSTTGNVENINIDFSSDGKATWTRLTTNFANVGSIAWKIPTTISSNCYVRVSDTSGSPADTSNLAFSITRAPAGSITVKSPNGGEKWEGSSSHNITWSSTGTVGNVKIIYTTNNGSSWKFVTSSTANNGLYKWTVPEAPCSKCLVKIIAISDSTIADTSDSVFTVTSGKPPMIQVLWDRYNFAYPIGGAAGTSPQTMAIGNSGGKTLNWSATANESWIHLDKTTGTGEAVVNIAVDPVGLPVGDYSGTISVSAPGAANSPQNVSVNLKVKNAEEDEMPLGDMATPASGSTVYGSIPITGWALDDVEIKSVKLYYNQDSYIGDMLFIEGARPDVAAAYSNYPLYRRAGWGYLMLTNSLPDGAYSLYAVATDSSGKTTTFGPKNITIANARSAKPFGNIDTPGQNGTASGTDYMNWGWALTKLPHTIPKDGSTIQVWVDSNFMGTLDGYNGSNAAIKSLFPGLKNSNGPTGFYRLDTTQFTNGVHLISWTVIDDGGHKEGVGSRYFYIYNPGNNVIPSSLGDEINAPQAEVYNSLTGVRVKKDYEQDISALAVQETEIYPDEEGRVFEQIAELQSIEIQLDGENGISSGYLEVDGKLEPLPIGSSLDPINGVFRWQPGPGFVGDYKLSFFGKDDSGLPVKKKVHLRIVPLFSE